MVDDYLGRLGFDGRPAPTVESLADIHRRHLERIPYENLAIMLGQPPPVDPLASLERIGRVGRAGYCFLHQGAVEVVLAELGFAVSRRSGAVWDDDDERSAGALNHLVLVVSGLPTDANPGGDWWPDVGLGDAIHEPLPLVAGDYEQGGFRYSVADVTEDGFAFLADPQESFAGMDATAAPTPEQVATCHAGLSTPPDGHFAKTLVVQRRRADAIDVVRGCLYTRITADDKQVTELSTYEAWRAAIADGCGLCLAEVDDGQLRGLFERMWAGHLEFRASRP
jgi:arylamine N-acetyltransferase